MNKNSLSFMLSIFSLSLLLSSCGKSFKGKTGTTTPPIKNIAYKFDSQNMCWSQGIVGGSVMSENDPLAKSMIIILSTFEDIKDKTKHAYLCSGTLISKNHILSAGHCFKKVGENLLAASFITANNMNCSSSFNKNLVFPINIDQVFYPKEFTAFEQPSANSPNNDLAIVSFDAILPADYSALPLSSIDLKKINSNQVKNLLMVGYGSAGTNKNQPPSLRSVTKLTTDLILQASTTANAASKSLIDIFKIIGVKQRNAKGGCTGDSGGALLLNTPQGYEIAGVGSYIVPLDTKNNACEFGEFYYTHTLSYMDWIKSVINNKSL